MSDNAFAITVAAIGHGDALEIASEKLAELVRAVEATGRKGTLTLSLEVKPRGTDSGQVELNATVASKLPVPEIAPSMFFIAEDGTLARDNPKQKKFPFADETPNRVKKAQ